MHFFKRKPKRIYLDHAAATPLHPLVLQKMRPYFNKHFGNPSAIHREGQTAREAVEAARSSVASILHVRKESVIFTGSGTESNNTAIYGLLRAVTESGILFEECEIVSTNIEHPSVREVLAHLASHGAKVHFVKLSEDGTINREHLRSLLNVNTRLVTFAYANSEVGAIEEVKKITRIVRKYNTERGTDIAVHLDASQAPLWLSCELDMLGVDLMTLDAGKCNGPKGVGVLAFQQGVILKGVVLGGGQESGLRAGTENTPLIVGCAEALRIAQEGWKSRSEAVASLRDFMIKCLREEISGVVLNGSEKDRLANNVNISIPGIDSEFAVVTLDAKGIAASTKSACGGASGNGSHVVRELTGDESRALSTIRFSLGEDTTKKDIEKTISTLKEHVNTMSVFRGDVTQQEID